MNSWNNQARFPPGYGYPAAGYWQHPAPAAPPAWHEPKLDGPFNIDRYKTRKIPTLHPILSADSTHARIDLRKQPAAETSSYYPFRQAYATSDYATHVRLISKDFPWSLDIKPKFGTPVTCENIWSALYSLLQDHVADSEWGTVATDKERAKKVEKAVKKRQESDKDKKLKRIDLLGDSFIFKGLDKDDEFAKRRLAFVEEECPNTFIVKMASS